MSRGPYSTPPSPSLDPSLASQVDSVTLTVNERSFLRQLLHAWHRDHMPAHVVALERKLR